MAASTVFAAFRLSGFRGSQFVGQGPQGHRRVGHDLLGRLDRLLRFGVFCFRQRDLILGVFDRLGLFGSRLFHQFQFGRFLRDERLDLAHLHRHVGVARNAPRSLFGLGQGFVQGGKQRVQSARLPQVGRTLRRQLRDQSLALS